MISMPGKSHAGPLPPVTSAETALAGSLRRDVEELAGRIGIRNLEVPSALEAAANYMESRLKETIPVVARQSFDVDGRPCRNIEATVSGSDRAAEIVIVGAHYDSVSGCPGANDNATGAAALLALAKTLAAARPSRTLRFVAFVNEEPPYFETPAQGSWVYAKQCRARGEKVAAMLSLETIGFYTDAERSQSYPAPLSLFYPSVGNFVAFVGNIASRKLVREAIGSFRRHTAFPSEGAAMPGWLPGIGWSDHWAFWQEGYPGIMVTDTAPFRYPHYHTPHDTPEKIDYERCARVVAGLTRVVADLAGGSV